MSNLKTWLPGCTFEANEIAYVSSIQHDRHHGTYEFVVHATAGERSICSVTYMGHDNSSVVADDPDEAVEIAEMIRAAVVREAAFSHII